MRQKPYVFDFTLSDIKEHTILPHNYNIERSVLGYFFFHTPDFNSHFKYLKQKGIFYNEMHSKIFDVIVQFHRDGIIPFDDKVAAYFKERNDRETEVYVLCLIGYKCNPSEIVKYCLILNESWIQRTFYRMGHFIVKNAVSEDEDKLQLLGTVSESISKIYLHIAGMKEKSLQDAGKELIDELSAIQRSESGMLGIASSISGINRTIKGYRNGNLIIIAASTGEGKTTLALQDAHHSLKMGIPIGYVSLEMATKELMLMMSCTELNINTESIMQGGAKMDDVIKVGQYVSKIEQMPFHITDKAGMTISEIKAVGKMWVDKYQIKQLFIDHIHLANTDIEYNNPEQKFTTIANKLKELAKELDIPVIALAQLARKELTDKRMHQPTDIKYAGGIEQAADVILMPFRPEHHGIENDADGNSTEGKAKIIVAKLRLLPKKNIHCTFNGMRFFDAEPDFVKKEIEYESAKLPVQSVQRPSKEFWND